MDLVDSESMLSVIPLDVICNVIAPVLSIPVVLRLEWTCKPVRERLKSSKIWSQIVSKSILSNPGPIALMTRADALANAVNLSGEYAIMDKNIRTKVRLTLIQDNPADPTSGRFMWHTFNRSGCSRSTILTDETFVGRFAKSADSRYVEDPLSGRVLPANRLILQAEHCLHKTTLLFGRRQPNNQTLRTTQKSASSSPDNSVNFVELAFVECLGGVSAIVLLSRASERRYQIDLPDDVVMYKVDLTTLAEPTPAAEKQKEEEEEEEELIDDETFQERFDSLPQDWQRFFAALFDDLNALLPDSQDDITSFRQLFHPKNIDKLALFSLKLSNVTIKGEDEERIMRDNEISIPDVFAAGNTLAHKLTESKVRVAISRFCLHADKPAVGSPTNLELTRVRYNEIDRIISSYSSSYELILQQCEQGEETSTTDAVHLPTGEPVVW